MARFYLDWIRKKESRFKTKIVSERGDIAIKLTEVKMIIRDHYEKYYMPTNGEPKNDKFLETYNLPRLNHAERGNLSRSLMIKKIELVIKKIS